METSLRMIMPILPSYCNASLRSVCFAYVISGCGIPNPEWHWDFYHHLYPTESSLERNIPFCAASAATFPLPELRCNYINRATARHCASCGAIEAIHPILLSCAAYHDCRLTLFTRLRLACRPHTTIALPIFSTGTEH